MLNLSATGYSINIVFNHTVTGHPTDDVYETPVSHTNNCAGPYEYINRRQLTSMSDDHVYSTPLSTDLKANELFELERVDKNNDTIYMNFPAVTVEGNYQSVGDLDSHIYTAAAKEADNI